MTKSSLRTLITLTIILLVVGTISWIMVNQGRVACTVCVSFNGVDQCSASRGATHAETIRQGHQSVCTNLAHGVTEILACERTMPSTVSCEPNE